MDNSFEHLHSTNSYEEYTRSYDKRFITEIRHLGLGTYRILKDLDSWILYNKVEAQFKKWDDQWAKIDHKNKTLAHKETNQNLADEQTQDAREKMEEINDILSHTLNIDDTIDWDLLKDKNAFTVTNPKSFLSNELNQVLPPNEPIYTPAPTQPNKIDYQVKLSFMDKLFKSKGQKKIEQSEVLFVEAMNSWSQLAKQTEDLNFKKQEQYNTSLFEYDNKRNQIKEKYYLLEKQWEDQMDEYYKKQLEHNQKIDLLKNQYLLKDSGAILQYCELVLNNSEYPEKFPKDFDLDYNTINRLLVIEYTLPPPDLFPRISEVKYIASKKELKEVFISDSQFSKIYDTTIYNICLRTLHEIFESDKVDAIDMIVFNGWVEAINKATGKNNNNCILSIQVKKTEFLEIGLANIDAKACFKNLKGIGSSKLIGITAIQPIIQINKNDKRFISSYEVANTLNETFNLATMDWEDFENLIRELFEKEFQNNGGEVKVTQASRDGGVDAIAFDPDQIRGGKIVIQAKRYTNTVGVSAVRDLYGTVMNEGATKGILVTTSDYGSDAYEFIKNKPLTLLNGSNLLYLLEKHGQKARIDLAEAKKMQLENKIT